MHSICRGGAAPIVVGQHESQHPTGLPGGKGSSSGVCLPHTARGSGPSFSPPCAHRDAKHIIRQEAAGGPDPPHAAQPPAHAPAPSLPPPREQLCLEPPCSPSRGKFPTPAPKVAVSRRETVQACCRKGHRESPHRMGVCGATADAMRPEMPQRSQGRQVGRGLHPPLYRANPRAQGPNAAHLPSLALMVTPALLPSIPPHNRVSPRHPHHLPCQERGRPDPGEKQGLPLGLSHLSLCSRQPCPSQWVSGQAGGHSHGGVGACSRVEQGTAHGPGSARGCVAGDSSGPGSGRRQPLLGGLHPPALPHPVSPVEKRNPTPPQHTHPIMSAARAP